MSRKTIDELIKAVEDRWTSLDGHWSKPTHEAIASAVLELLRREQAREQAVDFVLLRCTNCGNTVNREWNDFSPCPSCGERQWAVKGTHAPGMAYTFKEPGRKRGE
jgi:rubrerythrin